MKTKKLFLMAALALTFAVCSNDDNDIQTSAQQPAKAEGITITATLAPKSGGAATRAVSEGTNEIVASWAVNEHIAILYDKGGAQMADATITAVNATTGVATISFTVESGTTDGTACTLVYPLSAAKDDHMGVKDAATLLAAQDGTLNANLDVRVGEGTIQTSTPSLTVTTQPEAQFAIFKFTTKNADASAPINVTPLTITIGTQDYVITPSSATNTLYAALPAVSSQPVIFAATGSDSKIYTCSKDNVTFTAKNFYQSTLKMAQVEPKDVSFNNNNRNNFIEAENYFRCQLYNPWVSVSPAINPDDLQMVKGQKLSVTFTLSGFTFTQSAKMVLGCNIGSEQGWEPVCFDYSRAISVNSNGTYTVSWTKDIGAAVDWRSSSALEMTMQYVGYASLTDSSAEGLKAACEIVSIRIE